jgi:hypothetical protein
LDKTGYGGPQAYFSGINSSRSSGVVNFLGGIAGGGGQTYFGLEGAPSAFSGISATTASPEPATLATAGMGILLVLGYGWRRQRALERVRS